MQQIYIKSEFPTDIGNCTKLPYIMEIMRETKITDEKNVFFMDDTLKHIKAVEKYEIKAVLVEKDGAEYIHEAVNFLYCFNEEHGIYVDLDEPLTEPWGSDEENQYDQERMTDIEFEPLSPGYYDKQNLSDKEDYTPWDESLLGKG